MPEAAPRYRILTAPRRRRTVFDVVARTFVFTGTQAACEQYVKGANRQQEMFPDETAEVCQFVPVGASSGA